MRFHAVAFSEDLCAYCADVVINDFADQLPDIRSATILLPEGVAKVQAQVAKLQKDLLDCAKNKGFEGLMTPTITTPHQLFLRRMAQEQAQSQDADRGETSRRQEQLILAHSLKSHPELFPHQTIWQVSQSLIDLFDEISDLKDTGRYDSSLLKQSLSKLDPEIWDDDTKKFLSLWQVWEELILDKDHSLREMERKAFIEDRLTADDEHIYLCGIDQLPLYQTSWAKRLYAEGRLSVLAQGSAQLMRYPQPAFDLAHTICGEQSLPASTDPFSQFIGAVFSQVDGDIKTSPFAHRARSFAQKVTDSPLHDRVSVFAAKTVEEHAWGIYLAMKQWLEDNPEQQLAIVCLDRKLTRRIRAIFERYGLALQDCSGWEVSTTSSASAIFKLLPAEEEVLGVDTLITLLRSPYCEFEISYEQRLAAVHQIEQQITKMDQMPQKIDELLDFLKRQGRQGRKGAGTDTNDTNAKATQTIEAAMASIETLATQLKVLQEMADKNVQSEHPLGEYFDTLGEVMRAIGMSRRLSIDNAGKKLLNELNMLSEVVRKEGLGGDYHFWRSWLLHNLEKSRYIPRPAKHSILLMRPEQAQLWKVDAMVFAGLSYTALPSSSRGIMNENIRQELGLQTQQQHTAHEFALFRSILENSGKVLATYASQDKGKDMAPSLWLEAIQKFHWCAYGDDLLDSELGLRARHCQDLPIKCDISSTPSLQKTPAPAAPRGTWSKYISAQSYKTMLDCPYRYFARYCLSLKQRKRPEVYWTKLQFGNRIHRVLQALHSDVKGYPGPMTKDWVPENRQYAIDLATEIVEVSFAKAIQNQYVNSYWKRIALTMVEVYTDWLIGLTKQLGKLKISTEVEIERTLGQDLAGWGKIDLLLEASNQKTKQPEKWIIDYKTGQLPTLKSIYSGEDVQLAFYVLLQGDVKDALYLSLKLGTNENKLKQRYIDFNAQYDKLAGERLQEMHSDYQNGSPLVAWGDEKACRYCEWKGLCRRPAWEGLENQQ